MAVAPILSSHPYTLLSSAKIPPVGKVNGIETSETEKHPPRTRVEIAKEYRSIQKSLQSLDNNQDLIPAHTDAIFNGLKALAKQCLQELSSLDDPFDDETFTAMQALEKELSLDEILAAFFPECCFHHIPAASHFKDTPYSPEIAYPFAFKTGELLVFRSVEFCWYDHLDEKICSVPIKTVKQAHNLWILSQASEQVNSVSFLHGERQRALKIIKSSIPILFAESAPMDYFTRNGERWDTKSLMDLPKYKQKPSSYLQEFTAQALIALYQHTNGHNINMKLWGSYYSSCPREILNCLDVYYYPRDLRKFNYTVHSETVKSDYESKLRNSNLFTPQFEAIEDMHILVHSKIRSLYFLHADLNQKLQSVLSLRFPEMESIAIANPNNPVLEYLDDKIIRLVIAKDVEKDMVVQKVEINYRQIDQITLEKELEDYIKALPSDNRYWNKKV
ncbi:MAG: hypothetical protein WC222_05075 [Parachlamydiales bacterium]|jgi:hypothetical protein